jgi:Ca2+-binding RTX toxin-like protein
MNIVGTSGNDFLTGTNDLLNGDRMEGLGGNDILFGLAGDDTLLGGSGSDWLYGGEGSDAIFDNTDEDLFGDNGVDRLSGDGGDDFLYGGNGVDYLYGGNGDDWLEDFGDTTDYLYGGNGNDVIDAGNGADWLLGEAGDDLLNGKGGNDLLWGGSGADIFSYFFAAPMNVGLLGTDTIYDFAIASDRIEFDPKDFGLSDPSQIGLVSSDAAAATAAERIVYSRGSGTVWFNVNGTAPGFGSDPAGFSGGAIAVLFGAPNLGMNNLQIIS